MRIPRNNHRHARRRRRPARQNGNAGGGGGGGSSGSTRSGSSGGGGGDNWYPTWIVVLCIVVFSALFNLPRFFELRVVSKRQNILQKINDTGIPHLDYGLIVTVIKCARTYKYRVFDTFLPREGVPVCPRSHNSHAVTSFASRRREKNVIC